MHGPANSTSQTRHQESDLDKRRAREIFQWLQQIADDRSLPPVAMRLAVKLATKYFNGDIFREHQIHEAFPRQDTLASDLKIAERSIGRNVAALKARGHLIVIEPTCKGGQNRYRAVVSEDASVRREQQGRDADAGRAHREEDYLRCWPALGAYVHLVRSPRRHHRVERVGPDRTGVDDQGAMVVTEGDGALPARR